MSDPSQGAASESEDVVTGEADAEQGEPETNGVPTSDDTYSEAETTKGDG